MQCEFHGNVFRSSYPQVLNSAKMTFESKSSVALDGTLTIGLHEVINKLNGLISYRHLLPGVTWAPNTLLVGKSTKYLSSLAPPVIGSEESEQFNPQDLSPHGIVSGIPG